MLLKSLLLAAALAVSSGPVTPQETVTFPTGERVPVLGPTNLDDGVRRSPPWTHEQTLLSPRRDAAAVRFCWEAVKYHGCSVYLARPGGTVLELKNSNVTRLLWTGDGRYLIGAGENTVRLWNLAGGSRASVPKPFLGGKQQSVSHIERLWLRDTSLCVAMNSEIFALSGGYATGQLMTTTRYALPTLEPLQSVSPAVQGGQEAPCEVPMTGE